MVSVAIFICGPAGAGKSTLAKELVPFLNSAHALPFCLLDKDTLTDPLSEALLKALSGDGLDRDSPTYKQHVRDLEYESVLQTARENLDLGVNVVMPGPWTRELKSGALFEPAALGFKERARTLVIWLDLPESARLERIIKRANPRDAYKIARWDDYTKQQPAWGPQTSGGLLALDALTPFKEATAAINKVLAPLL